MPRHLAGLWLGKRGQEGNSSQNIPTTSPQKVPAISQRYLSRWPQAPNYWALPSMKSRHHGLDLMNWNEQTIPYNLYPKVWSFSMQYPIRVPKGYGADGNTWPRCPLPLQWHNPLSLVWEGRSEWGTVVNHLQIVHYRLGMVCNQCHDCPSPMADTLCHHSWAGVLPTWGEKSPQVSFIHVTTRRNGTVSAGRTKQGVEDGMFHTRLPHWEYPSLPLQP